uniref:Uncharacterized protein n=1 Tax=Rhizophora mucronata TaxID=61149 RepID=A0A2P2P8K8_RHIMU
MHTSNIPLMHKLSYKKKTLYTLPVLSKYRVKRDHNKS